ncbi:hypothetical protein PENTCL1PPCAC_24496, partial [Pristionchus entomophagus]
IQKANLSHTNNLFNTSFRYCFSSRIRCSRLSICDWKPRSYDGYSSVCVVEGIFYEFVCLFIIWTAALNDPIWFCDYFIYSATSQILQFAQRIASVRM